MKNVIKILNTNHFISNNSPSDSSNAQAYIALALFWQELRFRNVYEISEEI